MSQSKKRRPSTFPNSEAGPSRPKTPGALASTSSSNVNGKKRARSVSLSDEENSVENILCSKSRSISRSKISANVNQVLAGVASPASTRDETTSIGASRKRKSRSRKRKVSVTKPASSSKDPYLAVAPKIPVHVVSKLEKRLGISAAPPVSPIRTLPVKGKGNGRDSSQELEETAVELTRLKEQLAAQTTSFDAQMKLLQSIGSTLTCQICLEPLHRPFALVPCGHTACYSCLSSWFRAPPQDMQNPPPAHLLQYFDGADPAYLRIGSRALYYKKKTCPQCRAVVREAPIESWGIKSIVASLFSSGLSRNLFPGAEHQARDSAAADGSANLWNGFFPPHHTARVANLFENDLPDVPNVEENGHRTGGRLAPHEMDIIRQGDAGFFDREDGVHRCTHCMHEIWRGTCSSCGRIYPGLLAGDADGDVEDLEVNELDHRTYEGEHIPWDFQNGVEFLRGTGAVAERDAFLDFLSDWRGRRAIAPMGVANGVIADRGMDVPVREANRNNFVDAHLQEPVAQYDPETGEYYEISEESEDGDDEDAEDDVDELDGGYESSFIDDNEEREAVDRDEYVEDEEDDEGDQLGLEYRPAPRVPVLMNVGQVPPTVPMRSQKRRRVIEDSDNEEELQNGDEDQHEDDEDGEVDSRERQVIRMSKRGRRIVESDSESQAENDYSSDRSDDESGQQCFPHEEEYDYSD